MRIVDGGWYIAPSGKRVSIDRQVVAAVKGSVILNDSDVDALPAPLSTRAGEIVVTNESTCDAVYRLSDAGAEHVACLNFASSRSPGGGFLKGAQAQEECLARASALYACLVAQEKFYDLNRAAATRLNLDLFVWSPLVPFFRLDDSRLRQSPSLASIITAAAPDLRQGQPPENFSDEKVQNTFIKRAGLVLRIAAAHGVTHLVLGAWGCGVFLNDPGVVAKAFRHHLTGSGACVRAFEQVVFAIVDDTVEKKNLGAFQKTFA